ncbi:MAG: prepilin-type N-terminal cleavage/methylation domain-containing protein, partial [Candidatus Taylorbacteria bacterium]|nr:prepilin-type N-terminal cleavage/methylation domain-containing protein [Candidatus Taylorbacteria bacterium]
MNKHIPKNKYAEKRGFTIVETLVAITILMIAIAGPLVVASKSLFSSNLSKNQMVASYLAQESMEVVKNIRDNNLYLGQNWLQNGAGSLSSCTKSNPCDASAIDGSGQGGQYSSIVTCAGGP